MFIYHLSTTSIIYNTFKGESIRITFVIIRKRQLFTFLLIRKSFYDCVSPNKAQ